MRKYHTEYFTGIHKAIVSQKIFDINQKLLESSSKYTQAYRKTNTSLILLGVTKCGLCGSSLTTSSGKSGKYYYYKCSKQSHNTKAQCQAKQLPAEALENFVIQTIVHLIESDTFYQEVLKQIHFNKSDDLDTFGEELRNLKTNKTKLESQIKNLTERMANDTETTNSKIYSEPINIWEAEIERLSEEIIIKERRLEEIKENVFDKNELKNKLMKFVEIFRKQPVETQKRLTNLVFSEIVSEFKSNEKDGLITLKIRGKGNIDILWSEIKSANCKPVRTSAGSGSASKTRTYNPSVNSRMLYH